PTVAMSAPANGATVSGTTLAVSATASDNVGVAGVQFKLDGANLGAEDTAAPFSATWNTTTAANGSHTLTAVARDAAGNTATASTVSVTVSNTVATTDTVWVEDALPGGSWGSGTGSDASTWITASPAPFSGTKAHQTNLASGLHEHSVTVAATDATATINSTDNATLTFTRTGATTAALTVGYTLGGTAVKWDDYRTDNGDMPVAITIPAGASSATMTIVAVNNETNASP